MFAMWLMLGSPAQADLTDPTVTSPPTFTINVADQPITFSGVVPPAEVAAGVFNQIQIGPAPPPDVPAICSVSPFATTQVQPDGSWSCEATVLAVGSHPVDVVWNNGVDNAGITSIVIEIVDTPPPPPPPPNPPANPSPNASASPTPSFVPPLVIPTTDPTEPEPAPEPIPEALPELIPHQPSIPSEEDTSLSTWDPSDHPKEVLTLGAATFTALALIGPTGLALSSMAGAGATMVAGAAAASAVSAGGGGGAAARKKGGSVKAAKVKFAKFSAEGSGVGDQSRTWHTPGWEKSDAWGLAVPIWLATRSPLTARILIDGAYLRAMFGSIWALGIVGGLGLGIASAQDTGGLPIPPSLALTAALLVLAVFDATWGAAGVLGFGIGMLVWRSGELGLAPSVRSFLGLAALWFAIPLIASAARPFRRSTVAARTYAWDRFGDAVIATLIAGWATQKTIGGLPGLSGLDLPIAGDANRLALIAMAAVISRVLVEEFAAWRYPLRLGAVATGKLPFAGTGQRLFATGLRTVLFVFLAIAFIGNCWQLWVGTVLFLVPQVLSVYERSFPNSERLNRLLPSGILKVLVMLLIATFFGRLVFSILDNPDSMLRNGFILMSLPGLALSLIGLFGHDGPDPQWTWPRQMLGGVILLVTVGLVLTGW